MTKTIIVNKKRDYGIPARIYMAIIGQYAFAKGLKFFTLEEQLKAKARYENFAAINN